nr:MAG TPA_asm: hypothetical protein [Caudoviricetes sp.]
MLQKPVLLMETGHKHHLANHGKADCLHLADYSQEAY